MPKLSTVGTPASSSGSWTATWGGGQALGSPFVDGLVLDDYWLPDGPSEEDSHAYADCGLSPQDIDDVINNASALNASLYKSVQAQGSWIGPSWGNIQRLTGSTPRKLDTAQCATKLREACAPGRPTAEPLVFNIDYEEVPAPAYGVRPVNAELDMAYYLLARGRYAWVGAGRLMGWLVSHWWTAGQARDIGPRDISETQPGAQPKPLHSGTPCSAFFIARTPIRHTPAYAYLRVKRVCQAL
eukprot:gene4667-4857_t